jgi:signal transduction histidine kinase
MASSFPPPLTLTGAGPFEIADRPDASLAAVLQEQTHLKHQIAAQTEFIQLLTHQLATPLTALNGSVCLLAEQCLTFDQRQEFLDMVQQQVERLSHLLEDIVALRSAEADQLDPRPGCFAVADLVAEVSVTFAPAVVQQLLEADLPPVLADRWQVSQVLINLVSNAIKYSPPDAVVTVGAKRLPNHWIQVWVKDRGLGIPAADQARLFEPFFRVRHCDRQNIHGTGLGLSLCKLLVEKQGGTLDFTSTHGEGSCFAFTLPTG